MLVYMIQEDTFFFFLQCHGYYTGITPSMWFMRTFHESLKFKVQREFTEFVQYKNHFANGMLSS